MGGSIFDILSELLKPSVFIPYRPKEVVLRYMNLVAGDSDVDLEGTGSGTEEAAIIYPCRINIDSGGGALMKYNDHVHSLLHGHQVVAASSKNHLESLTPAQDSMSRQCCVVKENKYGGTTGLRLRLHSAVMNGRIDVMEELLKASTAQLSEVTARRETALHFAVLHNQEEALQVMVDWVKRTDNIHLINAKDRGGNTLLHLATSRKQLRTLEILLGDDPTVNAVVEVNAINAGGFTALDILDVLPQCGEIDMELDKILRSAGALRTRDITKPREAPADHLLNYQPSFLYTTKSVYSTASAFVLLTATLFATVTFHAALFPQLKNQNLTLTSCFIFFNSMGFFTSVAMILFLMLDYFPYKPWLLTSLFSLVGSYMCSIIEISPTEALALVFLGGPFVVLAATPTLLKLGLKCLQWGGIKTLGI